MAKLLSDPEFQRFSELQQKQSSFTITSEEADELRDIVARAQQKRDDRAAYLEFWSELGPVVKEGLVAPDGGESLMLLDPATGKVTLTIALHPAP